MAVIGGGIFAIAAAGFVIAGKLVIELSVSTAISALSSVAILMGCIIISIGIVLGMYGWSLKVMKKKEY